MAKLKYTVNGPGTFVVKGLIESIEFRPAEPAEQQGIDPVTAQGVLHGKLDRIIYAGESASNKLDRTAALVSDMGHTLDRIQQNLDAVSARLNRDPLAPVAADRAHISLGEYHRDTASEGDALVIAQYIPATTSEAASADTIWQAMRNDGDLISRSTVRAKLKEMAENGYAWSLPGGLYCKPRKSPPLWDEPQQQGARA